MKHKKSIFKLGLILFITPIAIINIFVNIYDKTFYNMFDLYFNRLAFYIEKSVEFHLNPVNLLIHISFSGLMLIFIYFIINSNLVKSIYKNKESEQG